jgi:predicted DCC family thiol-disulfide oxidoreductase YuxK
MTSVGNPASCNEEAAKDPSAMTVSDALVVIYDGACPFCSSYVRLVRLREAVGPVRLTNAREGGPEVEAARRAGLDLDTGMALIYGGRFYHGAECLTLLSALSSASGPLNRALARAFRDPRRARLLYPLLRLGRNAALWILRRGRL